MDQYTAMEPLRVTVGTWNVNGGKHLRNIAFKHATVNDWLLEPYLGILEVKLAASSECCPLRENVCPTVVGCDCTRFLRVAGWLVVLVCGNGW